MRIMVLRYSNSVADIGVVIRVNDYYTVQYTGYHRDFQ
jgi:hypothetical protein